MEKTEKNTEEDDGSLSFLKIPEQDGNKQFCLEWIVQACQCN